MKDLCNFLEKAVDGIRGKIGKEIKRSKCKTFEDFVNICETSGDNHKSVTMGTSDFYERPRNNKLVTMPKLADIVSVQFRKGESKMFYKTDFTAQYQSVEFLQQKCINPNYGHTPFPQTKTEKRDIAQKKNDDILAILKGVSSEKRKYWENLGVNDLSVDLCHAREAGEGTA